MYFQILPPCTIHYSHLNINIIIVKVDEILMNCSDREGPTEDPDSKGKLTNRRENDCAGLSASFVRDSFPEMAKRSSIFTVSSSGFLYLYKNRTLTFSSLLLSNFPFFHFLLRLPLHFISLVFLLVFFVRFL